VKRETDPDGIQSRIVFETRKVADGKGKGDPCAFPVRYINDESGESLREILSSTPLRVENVHKKDRCVLSGE